MTQKKRPIDRLRDGAGSMTIGTADNKSAITGGITFAEKLFIVKEKGLYQVQLADEFDPERSTISIPDAQKLVLKHGSRSEFVCRTFLLASELLKEAYLQGNIKRDRIMPHVLELTQKLSLMNEIVREHKKQERRIVKQIKTAETKPKKDDTAFDLPQIPNLNENFGNFLINAKFALQCLLDVAHDVYAPRLKKRYFTSLIKLAKDDYGEDDDFYLFLNNNNNFCQTIRKIRNCVEHPKPTERVDIHNTTLNPKGEVVLPHFNIIHPDYPNDPLSAMDTFNDVFKTLVFFCEAFIAHIVAKHIDTAKAKPFQIGIIRLPKDRRRYPYVEYSLGAFDGKNYIIAG